MVEYDENGYAAELKEKPVCRFCLTQDEVLTNIYSVKSNANLQVSLSMQIMACVSIEVFADDEMPVTICNACRLLMEFCYRFKQMCKKADTLLKQYPLTGMWPDKLEHPKFPFKLVQPNKLIKIESRESAVNQTLKRKLPQTSYPASKRMMPSHVENDISIEDMAVEFADETTIDAKLSSSTLQMHTSSSSPHTQSPQSKILNSVKTQPIKILNKQASLKSIEPVFRPPVLKTSEDGKIEAISEIIETNEIELDPIKNAAPVETNVFPCNYCERSFPLRQLLDIHVANHVRDRKFQCTVCNKGFFSKYDLGKHELIHTGEKPYQCVVCGKAFSRSTLLRRHEKVHSDQPKFLCAYCERPFLSKEEWEKHTQNHQKKRPYACEYCGKSFAFKQGLERHEVVHSSDQPYKCEHCDQGFSTQGKLARHLTAHAGDRPYPCRICDKSYLLSHHLTRHMRSHKENNQISLKCTECDLTFSRRDELISHSSLHATETLVCPLCKTSFDSVDDVSEHIKQHTEGEQFACEFCDLIFLTEAQLQEHSDTQHLEEIEFYEMSNMNDDNLDDSEIYQRMKIENDEMIEYTEQIEVITPDDDHINDDTVSSTPIKTGNRSISGRSNEKPNQTIKVEKIVDVKVERNKLVIKESNPEQRSKRLSYGKASSVVSVRSPNTRASSAGAKNSPKNDKSPDPPIITRSNKTSPSKGAAGSEKSLPIANTPVKGTANTGSITSNKAITIPATTAPVAITTAAAATAKKATLQTSLTNFVSIKAKAGEQSSANPTTVRKLIPLPTLKTVVKEAQNTISGPKLVNKLVKVKQIRMTKAQIEALTKQGKIEMRGGQVIFKDKLSPKKK